MYIALTYLIMRRKGARTLKNVEGSSLRDRRGGRFRYDRSSVIPRTHLYALQVHMNSGRTTCTLSVTTYPRPQTSVSPALRPLAAVGLLRTLPTLRGRVRCNQALHFAYFPSPCTTSFLPGRGPLLRPSRSRAQCRWRPRGGGRPSRGGRGLREGQVQPGKGVQVHRQWRRERVYGGGDLRDVQELPRVQRQPELRLGPRLFQVSRRAAREEGVPVQVPRW